MTETRKLAAIQVADVVGYSRLAGAHVNLDPRRAIETDLEIPFWRFGLPDEAAIGAEDLMRAQSVTFHGKRQRVRLDPSDLPFAIWRLDNPGGRRYGQAP